MYAKVREDSKIKQVTACAGRQFFMGRYVEIPAGFEDEAKANPYLETVNELPDGDQVAGSPLKKEMESASNPSDAPDADSSPKEESEEKVEPAKPKRQRRTTRKKSE